ncbi:MAG TPA: sugar ABC transporter permease, partial [Gaiellales bacterium]|nr:sugar ABC transporter permease [Gaiellales bacterium]
EEPAEAVARRGRKVARRAPGEPRNVAWLYILPGLAFYLLFTLAPLAHTIELSFFDWDGLTVGHYIGLENYREAFSDPLVRAAFKHSAELIVFYAVLPVILGLLLTALLTRHPVRGFTFFRTALFLPQMVAGVVVAQAWVWIYAQSGPLNAFLNDVGLGTLARPWLGDFTWALPAVGGIGTWVTYGLCMVLFVAGAQSLPASLYDAARVDGAGPVREFFAVTLPGLRNQIVVAFVLTTINALRSFDIIYNTTSGGPGTSTYVPSYYMYRNAFVFYRVGYAAAIAVILTAAIFALAGIVLYVSSRGEK